MNSTEIKLEINKIIDQLPEDKLEVLTGITALQINHEEKLIDEVIEENSELLKKLAE